MRMTVKETINWLTEHFDSDDSLYFVSITAGEISQYEEAEVSDKRFVAMSDYVDKSYDLDQDLTDAFADAYTATHLLEDGDTK